ncbi:hypothetical protein [Micromonospora sp. 4G55]|uniref:hypothetical protein n=1 Tax=Micromonospora sp. 4G55 TaxID=2806102 RepID=UPI001A368443|nr:hypothetical protein [Micromonospora sp. 4G55]MBM0257365.1 hypothetical protein [Micromonospora sp. 4G55]
MHDIVDQIDAAIDGRCACGCGARITHRSPSAYYATERCQDRWISQQRGDPTPTPPPYPGTQPPAAGQPEDHGQQPLEILFRQGYRLATYDSAVPWMRRCHHCGHIDTPDRGRRRATVPTIDPVRGAPDFTVPPDEPVNLCPNCATPTPGPYLIALWRESPLSYRLTLVTGDRCWMREVTADLVERRPIWLDAYVASWRDVERNLLRDLAPRCEHTAGCGAPARDRYELRTVIRWQGDWLTPGRTLLLCGPHGAEFHHHCLTNADPLLGPAHDACRHEPLDWVRA